MRFLDPDGMLEELYIRGSEAEAATAELQKSTSLTLTRDEKTGKVSATGTAETKEDKKLLKVINSTSVAVGISAESTTTTDSQQLYVGGAFSGNALNGEDGDYSVSAKQEVNPGVLEKASTANGKPGADMLHEVTEAYEGGLISLKRGSSSPEAGQPGSAYNKAHRRATKQSGDITETYYNSANKVVNADADGNYPGATKAVWTVTDKDGIMHIIQTVGK